ncbi:Clp protease N-terminal domain-containing protein [Actinomadura chibensis]|uniref:Clp protease n=1 Tax=Actinomadura chibensis TaxID=392828 RepID=A0A5D0NKH6_9ACTN|nr:Clp protease N-terminal domain-containing protein [Actinomadura chibensis]TYB44799.1 Clp protease [Actinomadura chibensis]
MFERFTADAREIVVGAQEEARRLRHHHIGTEHLLLALLAADCPEARAAAAHGLTADDVRARLAHRGDPLDPEALSTLGIDLDAVREATERTFGEGALDVPAGARKPVRKGHIPFTPRAKKALELSLRQSIRLKSGDIRTGHLLLGLLQDEGFLSARLAAEAGVDLPALRAEAERLTRSQAA